MVKPVEEGTLTDEEVIHGFDVVVWAFERPAAFLFFGQVPRTTYANEKGFLLGKTRRSDNFCHGLCFGGRGSRRRGARSDYVCKRANVLKASVATMDAKAEDMDSKLEDERRHVYCRHVGDAGKRLHACQAF